MGPGSDLVADGGWHRCTPQSHPLGSGPRGQRALAGEVGPVGGPGGQGGFEAAVAAWRGLDWAQIEELSGLSQ